MRLFALNIYQIRSYRSNTNTNIHLHIFIYTCIHDDLDAEQERGADGDARGVGGRGEAAEGELVRAASAARAA